MGAVVSCFEFVVIIFLPIFELKLQRITLAGDDFTLCEKNFTGNHLNLSAADKVKEPAAEMCGLKAFTDSNTMSRMQIGERYTVKVFP
ncbi:YoaW [Bacillus velezensis YAU B9601-Y2]|uniref:YoaW n=1 Tax=Bacillus amyloliquefaciens (strain Y2) TaxID=1155777 RepID=I2C5X2_BACAY|nr:YoaW [Bacillus velezensis YAU B9601-Y2]SLC51802.1 Uncharacterised protein [Mycobacteroides abscessus subsp. massiliense]